MGSGIKYLRVSYWVGSFGSASTYRRHQSHHFHAYVYALGPRSAPMIEAELEPRLEEGCCYPFAGFDFGC